MRLRPLKTESENYIGLADANRRDARDSVLDPPLNHDQNDRTESSDPCITVITACLLKLNSPLQWWEANGTARPCPEVVNRDGKTILWNITYAAI